MELNLNTNSLPGYPKNRDIARPPTSMDAKHNTNFIVANFRSKMYPHLMRNRRASGFAPLPALTMQPMRNI